MEEVEKDADVCNDAWIMDVSVSHEVTVLTQEPSEGGISADNSLQNLTQTENSDGQNNGRNSRNDEQNFACPKTDATVVTRQEVIKEMHNFEKSKLAEKSFQHHSFTENSEKSVKEVNTNKPSTSKQVPVKDVPQAILCSLQKLFSTAQSKRHNRGIYPQTTYRFTPIVNAEENNDVDIAEQNVAPAGAIRIYIPFKGRAAYPARNTGNIDLENTCFLSFGQYNRIGNDNRRIGLKNTGSTCYINCVMQVLLATHKFSALTVTKMFVYPYWAVLAELFGTMMFTVHPVINPKKYYAQLNSLQFNVFQEHDVSEFFIYLIEMLRSSEPNWDRDWPDDARPSRSSDVRDHAVAGCSYQAAKARPKKRPNIIGCGESRKYYVNNMFGGVIATMVKCHVCKNVSNRYEMLYILHLSIPDVMNNEVLTIQRLLDNYFTSEILSGVNRYMCNICRRTQNALKSSVVLYTPKYLILTLKNFSYDPKLRISTKKNSKIRCEENIIMPYSTRQKDRTMYELYAVIVHRGISLSTGHYTALTKYRHQWYMINDTEIYTIDFSYMNHFKIDETPYMLFYRRSDIKEGGFPDYDKIPWFSRYAENEPDAPRDK